MDTIRRSIGLTLTDEERARLVAFANAHHWSMAQAARVIVLERLNAEKEEAEG